MKKELLIILISIISCFSTFKAQTLTFKYDDGGNQVVRRYCESCSHMQKSSSTLNDVPNKEIITNVHDIKIYPNPTKDKVTLVWSQNTDMLIQRIEYVAYNFTQFRPLNYEKGTLKATIDLTTYPIGLYVVIFHLTNGEKLTYKILKH